MKLISWNVNGIRAALSKGFLDVIEEHQPDIIGLQEVKARPEQVNLEIPGYSQWWNPAQKAGYSGTAIFSRYEPNAVTYGIGHDAHDGEGRVITAEFDDYYLVNVYTPNAKRELLRLDYRMEWDREFLKYLKKLEEKKPVIFCGDLNVAHQEIDLANPRENRRNPGFTDEERGSFDALMDAGFVDTFRHFNKDPHHYTWWSYMAGARARNIGWRIDYFLTSPSLAPRLKNAFILPEVMGSDHCPVGIELE